MIKNINVKTPKSEAILNLDTSLRRQRGTITKRVNGYIIDNFREDLPQKLFCKKSSIVLYSEKKPPKL